MNDQPQSPAIPGGDGPPQAGATAPGTPLLRPGMPGPLYLEPPTSGLAIASMVVGIVSFVTLPLIGHIIALVLGYVARNQIRTSGGRISGDGFALTGIILGYLGIAVTVLLIALIVAASTVFVNNVIQNLPTLTPTLPGTPTP